MRERAREKSHRKKMYCIHITWRFQMFHHITLTIRINLPNILENNGAHRTKNRCNRQTKYFATTVVVLIKFSSIFPAPLCTYNDNIWRKIGSYHEKKPNQNFPGHYFRSMISYDLCVTFHRFWFFFWVSELCYVWNGNNFSVFEPWKCVRNNRNRQ